jgi:hypothetical protein
MRNRNAISALASVALGVGASAALAERSPPPTLEFQPDATLRLSEGRLSTGLAYMWGSGRLTFHDRHHDFNISGAPVAMVSAPSLSATGKVYHLTRLSDFAGTYTAADRPSATAGDEAGVPMKNEHGVLIMLRVATAGSRESHATGSVHIQLKE